VEIIARVRAARLYGILDLGYVEEIKALAVAEQMLEGGVQVLQLRAKGWEEGRLFTLGPLVASLCRRHHVPFILNDFPGLVPEIGADGVHVGQDDLPVAQARELAGPGAIVGKSTHSLAQAVAAQAEGADYIGFGPLFATPTKPDYPAIGLEQIAEAHRLVALPIFCIGGIKCENLEQVLAAGARRVVVVSGILQAPDVPGYCQSVLQKISQPL